MSLSGGSRVRGFLVAAGGVVFGWLLRLARCGLASFWNWSRCFVPVRIFIARSRVRLRLSALNRQVVFVDKNCRREDSRPEPIFVADSGLRDVARTDNLP